MTRFKQLGAIARWSALGVGALVLGCSDPATSPNRPLLPNSPSRQVVGEATSSTPNNEFLRVCKVWVNATVADIDVTLSGGGSGTYTVPAASGTAPNTCVVVAIHGGPLTNITVTEADPGAGFTTTWAVNSTNDAKDASGSGTSTSADIGGAEGATITFTNTYTPPSNGCTLTLGYWKNHTEEWDEVSDPNTASFITSTTFYNSGETYLQILNEPTKGSAYLILAHQFIAAELNVGAGASTTSAVDAALSGADAYFSSAPSGIPSPGGTLRAQLIGWAETLDGYNNGFTGPGHCGD